MGTGLRYEREVRSPQEMDDLAATLAPLLRPGDVIVLNGEMGAGKTRFVQGVAAALGVVDAITSPTFAIQLAYDSGSLPLNHFDLYRLEDASELEDIGYWDTLEGQGASFVEWGDKFPDEAPVDFVEMIISGSEQSRTVQARAYGSRARRLLYLWAEVPEAHWRALQ